MSAPVYKLEKDLCRCCHAEGSFFKLSDTVFHSGQADLYSEMLKNTLDINILPMEGDDNMMTYTICRQCEVRLRDAHKFKQQVTVCEQKFKDMYKNMVLRGQNAIVVVIKQEIPATFEEDVKQEVGGSDKEVLSPWAHDNNLNEDQTVVNIKMEPKKPKPKPKPKTKPKAIKVKLIKKKAPPKIKNQPSSRPLLDTSNDEELKTRKGSRLRRKRPIENADYKIEGENYVCCHCDKTLNRIRRGHLMDHIQYKHFKIPKFPCQYCNMAFMTEAPLTLHKLQQHCVDDRRKCNGCDAAFNTKRQLDFHMKSFHKLGAMLKCDYDYCEYETVSSEYLQNHMLRHKAEREFQCEKCKKFFKSKKNLHQHKKIHTNDKRKICKECGKAFVQKASLNYHMTKYHPQVNF